MNEVLFMKEELEQMDLCKEPLTDLEVQLTGENGNVYNLVGIVCFTLERNDYQEYSSTIKANFRDKGSYQDVIEYLSTFCKLV